MPKLKATAMFLAASALAAPSLALAETVILQTQRLVSRGGGLSTIDEIDSSALSTVQGAVNTMHGSFSATGNVYTSTGTTLAIQASSAAEQNVGRFDFSADGRLIFTGYGLYPASLGRLGEIRLTSSNTSGCAVFVNDVELPSGGSLPLTARSYTFSLTGGKVAGFGDSALSLSGTASFEVVLDESITRRVHWRPTSFNQDTPLDSTEQWVEGTLPTEDELAVFGRFNRNHLLTLPSNTSWAGLLAEAGNTTSIDLDGKTLSLGTASVGTREFSIMVGEQRVGFAGLGLRNGNVVCESNILIEGRSGLFPFAPQATLAMQQGGKLVAIRSIISAGLADGTEGTLLVEGAGSTVEATAFIGGVFGNGKLLVLDGGSAQFLQEVSLGSAEPAGGTEAPSQFGSATISGFGSRLIIGEEGEDSRLNIGRRGGGTLEVIDGAAAILGFSAVGIGGGSIDNARMTVRGIGSVVVGGTYNIASRSLLEVRNDASLATADGGGIGLASLARFEVDRNSQATVGSLLMPQPEASAIITRNSVLNFSELVLISAGSRLLVADRSRLQAVGQDNGDLSINGTLLVGGNSAVHVNTLGIGATGTLVVADSQFTVGGSFQSFGKIIADKALIDQLTPGDDDGGGGGGGGARPGALDAGNPNARTVLFGDLEVMSTGSIELGVYSPTQFDEFLITGDLSMSGRLLLNFASGQYAPLPGDIYIPLTVQGTTTGLSPDDILPVGLLPGWEFDATVDPLTGQLVVTSLNAGVLAAIPEPSALAFVALALPLARRRR